MPIAAHLDESAIPFPTGPARRPLLRTAPRPPAPRWLQRPPAASGGPPLSGVTVAVVGLGHVGLPLALGLWEAGARITGVDRSEERLAGIHAGRVDVLPARHAALACAERDDAFALTARPDSLGEADAVLVCVPTPVAADRARTWDRTRPAPSRDAGRTGGGVAPAVRYEDPGQPWPRVAALRILP
ncbi:NAD(P)-binding domain-containing protein [Streptomyces sp. NRRL S-340]|uniref:NAD(P)-binding domain-containing protein n=1 Tax=Streptomyces sp. NRRL S-340 TaxID=1463901 RepID=UPI00131B5F3E|nr:NAD(P)-binding domain-containing protein [Streptomyces sp. NRRL S-340]